VKAVEEREAVVLTVKDRSEKRKALLTWHEY